HIQVFAAATAPANKPARVLWQLDFTQPTLFLLGNEGAGLSQELIQLADTCVQIPMQAGVESLNVAIAGAILLYEARRQRQTVQQ
ncbi:MAG: TrmH family RNA methyltransferase, partial [Cyanobacteria bacterium P01_F01_bin.33]